MRVLYIKVRRKANEKREKAEGRKQKADKTKSFRFGCLLPTAFCLLSLFHSSSLPFNSAVCDGEQDAIVCAFEGDWVMR